MLLTNHSALFALLQMKFGAGRGVKGEGSRCRYIQWASAKSKRTLNIVFDAPIVNFH